MIINLLATWIPALPIALLGVLKLSGNPKIAEEMSRLGVGRYLRLLGVMEIAFAVLFVVPATMKLGFILASCYFGGAIATDLSHDALNVNPFIPLHCSGSALSFGIARFFSDTQLSADQRSNSPRTLGAHI
jgi:hypothetical protein